MSGPRAVKLLATGAVCPSGTNKVESVQRTVAKFRRVVTCHQVSMGSNPRAWLLLAACSWEI